MNFHALEILEKFFIYATERKQLDGEFYGLFGDRQVNEASYLINIFMLDMGSSVQHSMEDL